MGQEIVVSKHQTDCHIAFAWCSECLSVHVAVFDKNDNMLAMGDVGDIPVLVSKLQQAKDMAQVQ